MIAAEVVEIPVPNVTADVLAKVVDYMTHFHKEPMTAITTPLRSNVLSEMVQPYYVEFVNVPRNMLFDLVAASNYMNVKPLLDLTCLATAVLIKGKRYV
jgi:S-phase kinase-associated protein 1